MNYENIKEQIEEELKELLGQPLIEIGRAANLLWLSFGEKITVIDRNGHEKVKSKFSLNIQCSWRLIKENRIIVASKDIYLPRTNSKERDFDWDNVGANRFDEKIEEFKKQEMLNIVVSKISADEYGGVKLHFKTGEVLDVFPDDSLEDEFWRLIISGKESKHFVVFDNC
jgi:hypothetical protein